MTILAKVSYPLEVSAGPTAGLADDKVSAIWAAPASQPVEAHPGTAREVSGRKVVLAALITLALNAACVLTVLGDQLALSLEMLSIGLLVASSFGAIAVMLGPRHRPTSEIAAQHTPQPPLLLLRTK